MALSLGERATVATLAKLLYGWATERLRPRGQESSCPMPFTEDVNGRLGSHSPAYKLGS